MTDQTLSEREFERQLLLDRINHLDEIAVGIRNIAIPVFVAVLGGCIGLTLASNVKIPLNIHYSLPIAVAFLFLLIEARIRAKYQVCKDRWNFLIEGRATGSKQVERPFDWVSAEMTCRHWAHREQVWIYATMVIVTLAVCVWSFTV